MSDTEAEAERASERAMIWGRASIVVAVIATVFIVSAVVSGNAMLHRYAHAAVTMTLAVLIGHLQAKVQLLSAIVRGILEHHTEPR